MRGRMRFGATTGGAVEAADAAHAGFARAQGTACAATSMNRRARRCLEGPGALRPFQVSDDLFTG